MEFFGKYRGVVVDIGDPEKRQRIRVSCPAVYGKTNISPWALPCLPANTQSVPEEGTLVWVEFEGGLRDLPIWTGVFYTTLQHKDLFGEPYKPDEIKVRCRKDYFLSSKLESITLTAKYDFRTRTALGINDLD